VCTPGDKTNREQLNESPHGRDMSTRSNPRVSGVNLMGNWGEGNDTACGPKFESLIHIIGHDKTSDTVEDNLY